MMIYIYISFKRTRKIISIYIEDRWRNNIQKYKKKLESSSLLLIDFNGVTLFHFKAERSISFVDRLSIKSKPHCSHSQSLGKYKQSYVLMLCLIRWYFLCNGTSRPTQVLHHGLLSHNHSFISQLSLLQN